MKECTRALLQKALELISSRKYHDTPAGAGKLMLGMWTEDAEAWTKDALKKLREKK